MYAYIFLGLSAAALGFAMIFLALRLLPNRLKSDQLKEKLEILEDARRLAASRKAAEFERLEDERLLLLEQLDAEIHERNEDLKTVELDLAARERTLQFEESRIQKIAKDLEAHTQKAEAARAEHESKKTEIEQLSLQLVHSLESIAKVNAESQRKALHEGMIEKKQFEVQKALRFLDDDLSSSQKRLATRMISRAMARYAPEFYWPKMHNAVELLEPELVEKLNTSEGLAVIEEVKNAAEIEAELLASNEGQIPIIKLAGGAGINREAARLALSEIISKGPSAWTRAKATYDQKRALLERHALLLGRQALKDLKLEGIHPEIMKMVGYLNWRTSYRQNQWYHTVEVARLAGILAAELGIDVDAAKRVGLLHDIGKAIDYRIEGSHAVISGDYADRYGEKRLICDTVMSHHNDLIVESPLAYVLRAADTLSGARPGARVNLEEGYQMRLSGIEAAVRSFPGIINVSIMNGAREVHVEVNHKKVQDRDLSELCANIARKIEVDVAFPGEIKILVTRRFEVTAVA